MIFWTTIFYWFALTLRRPLGKVTLGARVAVRGDFSEGTLPQLIHLFTAISWTSRREEWFSIKKEI